MSWDRERYQRAIQFAGLAHGEQKVPGSTMPYLVHVADVCQETLVAMTAPGVPGDINLAMTCALLHDTIEDTAVTYENIKAEFGERVADGVLALTKDLSLPKARRMQDSLERILQQGPEVRVVKMADRVSNLRRPPAHWSLEKRQFYREEARLILKMLQGVNPVIEQRLAGKIERYASYFQ